MSNVSPKCMVTVRCSGAIIDPDLVLDVSSSFGEEPRAVAADTRLDLRGGEIVLFFSGSRFVPFLPEPHARFPYYPLLHFLIFRSRIHYNYVCAEWLPEPPPIDPADEVVFALSRLVRVEREEHFAGRTHRLWHYQTQPHSVAVGAKELEDLLRVCTPQLYLALTYFLIGCENIRYFLVEFYKAIEAIENVFGGEARAIDALKSYGVVRDEFKTVKRYASDQRRPFDIGRHAPQGLELQVVDVRRLLEEPVSHEVFRRSVVAVRQAIDAYFAFLRA